MSWARVGDVNEQPEEWDIAGVPWLTSLGREKANAESGTEQVFHLLSQTNVANAA